MITSEMRTSAVQVLELSLTAPLSPNYEGVVARFELWLRDRAKAPLSIRTYLSSVTRFLAFLQHSMGLDIPLDTISKEHAREWLRALQAAGLKEITIRGRAQGAQQMFKAAIEDGEATTNPFVGLALPTVVMPEPQKRSSVTAGALTSHPASSTDMRPIQAPCLPDCELHPQMTSSTSSVLMSLRS